MKLDAPFPLVWVLGSCAAVLVIIATTALIGWYFKSNKLKRKSHIILLKECPPFKNIQINQQFEGASWPSTEKLFTGVDRESSKPLETRPILGDPLLDVLHTNQLTKERLEKNKFLHQKARLDSELPIGATASPKREEHGVPWEDGLSAELALVWASNDRSLNLVLVSIDNCKSACSDLFVSIRLEGTKTGPREVSPQMQGQKRPYGKKDSMTYSFKGLSLEEAHGRTLLLDLSEKKTRFAPEEVLARGRLPLSELVLVPNTPLPACVRLRFARDDGLGSHLIETGLGSLLISLKCCFVGQISAKFMATAKRAEKLPVPKIGGECKVELFVLREQERLYWFTSGLKSGACPEWNSSFTFDISRNNISDYSLEFVIIRVGRLSGPTKVAKTTLCQPSGGTSNTLYWEDAIEKLGQEIIWRRNLKSPRFGDARAGIRENTMGLMLISLEEKIYSKKKCMSQFEVVVKTMAHLEYTKNGGDYKVELWVRRSQEDALETFTTGAAPCTSLTWNAAFTFLLPRGAVGGDRSLVFNLFRIGRMRKSLHVGRGHLRSEDWAEMTAVCGRLEHKWIQIIKI